MLTALVALICLNLGFVAGAVWQGVKTLDLARQLDRCTEYGLPFNVEGDAA